MPLETPEPLRRVETRETPQGRQASQEMRRSVSRRSESRHAGDGETYAREEPMENDDEDAESDGAEGDSLAEDEFSRQQMIYAAQQRNMGLLSQVMDEDQLERHMASRRGTLNKASVRKLINHVLSQSVNQHFVMAASGVGKVFVGEMVEQGTCFFFLLTQLAKSRRSEKRRGRSSLSTSTRRTAATSSHKSARGTTRRAPRAAPRDSDVAAACFRYPIYSLRCTKRVDQKVAHTLLLQAADTFHLLGGDAVGIGAVAVAAALADQDRSRLRMARLDREVQRRISETVRGAASVSPRT